MHIKNQRVAITGANRGIGRALAQAAAKRGAHVILIIRLEDPTLVKELRDLGAVQVEVITCDMTNRSQLQELIQKLNELEIEILINNAGLLTGGQLERQPIQEIYSMMQVNVLSLIELTHGILPGMLARKKGKIVNNASVSAVMHFPGASTYAAAKAAVYAFTNSLELELSGSGVSTLLLLTPGVKTRMFDAISDKYGENLDLSLDSIPADIFADQVMAAIEGEASVLEPQGATAWGLTINKFLPQLFKKAVKRRFHRI